MQYIVHANTGFVSVIYWHIIVAYAWRDETPKKIMSIALPAECLQYGVNIYILPFHGLMG